FYATFAYTKIIIDEIQAYSPECAAVIIKALQMINDIGGKFLVMTATLPKIYTEELKKRGINIEVKSFLSDAIRHKISLKDKDIEEDVDFIKECGKTKKILVIVNTVNKAIEMYDKLKDKNLDVNLLHSRFIQEDRANKERDVLKFALNDKNRDKTPGIWVTTQIVEASLDVDFDMLFTENSSLDSLFQRFGRCFRSRIYSDSSGLANVFVYKKASGISYIYDKEIAEKSYEMLLEFDDKTIDEKAKVEMVDRLYSRENLRGTEYLKNFDNGLSFLDNMIDYDISSKEAQKLLRDVDNYTVIPKDLYDKNFKLFEDYNDLTKEWEKATKDRKDEIKKRKYELLTDIKKLTISIMSKQVDNAVKNDNRITFVPDLSGFYYVIGANYTSEYGLIFNGKNMNID
ncbi:MAG: CRISPR-associated helicase Cas3', partial [Oscillospiraceae bacterium]|nr:CRISPR-associated helicase Cas3' [Oscillospiraceae bacterium]